LIGVARRFQETHHDAARGATDDHAEARREARVREVVEERRVDRGVHSDEAARERRGVVDVAAVDLRACGT
jgi:hypothetical protein